jgi:subtilisin family serine protease
MARQKSGSKPRKSRKNPPPKAASAARAVSPSETVVEAASDLTGDAEPVPPPSEATGKPAETKPQIDAASLDESDPRGQHFTPETLDSTVIAIPLLKRLDKDEVRLKDGKEKHLVLNPRLFPVVIDLNLKYPGGRDGARQWVIDTTKKIIEGVGQAVGIPEDTDKDADKLPGLEYIIVAIDEKIAELKKEREDMGGEEGEDTEPVKKLKKLKKDIPPLLQAGQYKEFIRLLDEQDIAYRQGINRAKSDLSHQYLFAILEGKVIRELVRWDGEKKENVKGESLFTKIGTRAIYHLWPDFPIRRLINKSLSTVKADAAQSSFAAFGEDIVWAVLDSGIEANHPHFAMHDNLTLQEPLTHTDFTRLGSSTSADAQRDAFGHGTHVAGIIAGQMRVMRPDEREFVAKVKLSEPALEAQPGEPAPETKPAETKPAIMPGVVDKIRAFSRLRDENGKISFTDAKIESISGMAPKCKLLSFKVLDDKGGGLASNLIAAIAKIQEINGYGRRLLIHGINMSVGYDFEPEWFACGQSPLCVEVNRLVRSGVVVVVAAGNTGYGVAQSQFRGVISAGMDLTINDPGNADLAITVGSTHRTMPHIYGVSYFSSKGPTGDGRAKPDLVAPGEKILSCAAGKSLAEMKAKGFDCDYLEESGTSMAAPHVSGVIAAFLSIRREFIGYPEKVKEILLATATDLKRERYFQGYGLVDLMRAIQSV